jgi:hypothetical protein
LELLAFWELPETTYLYTALPRQEWKTQLRDAKNNSVDMMEYDLGRYGGAENIVEPDS